MHTSSPKDLPNRPLCTAGTVLRVRAERDSQAPDVDLRTVRLGTVKQFRGGVFGRPTVSLERFVLLVHVA